MTKSGVINYKEGRLEVFHGGQWGTVCDDGHEERSHLGNVVCRMLGYSYGITKGKAFYGAGKGPILLDDVSCGGSARSLADCSFRERGNCVHIEDVGVQCH